MVRKQYANTSTGRVNRNRAIPKKFTFKKMNQVAVNAADRNAMHESAENREKGVKEISRAWLAWLEEGVQG